MSVYAVGLLLPLLSTFTYRHTGQAWPRAMGLAVAAVVLTVAGGIAIGFVYGLVFTVEAGLCGDTPWEATAAAIVAYLGVASWAAIRPARIWAWLLPIGSGVSALLLVEYFFTSAHTYCET